LRCLAIDTALNGCSACVLETGAAEPLAMETLPIERGHAEALLPLVERVMAKVEGGFGSLDRVAVTVGPGSFTGLRVGLSAARAIALAANVPCVGVTTLAAYAAPLIMQQEASVVVAAIDARHGHVYVQAMAPRGMALITPRIAPVREAVRMLGQASIRVVGTGADIFAQDARAFGLNVLSSDCAPSPDITFVARLGLVADPASAPPRPYYLRAPDAKPQGHARIARVDSTSGQGA